MRKFLQTHRRKIGPSVIIATIVVSTTVLIPTSTPVIMYLTPSGASTIEPGNTIEVDVNVNARIAIDSIGATLTYPKEIIEIVGVSKDKSFFNLWTEDLVIHEDTGHVVFSGGTTHKEGLTGTGTIMTLTIKGKTAGEATITFDNVRIYPHDGTGKPINTEKRSLTFAIAPRVAQHEAQESHTFLSQPTAPEPARAPSPDFNRDGKVNLTDLSMLLSGLMSPTYSPHYDLNTDGVVGLRDLSIALSRI